MKARIFFVKNGYEDSIDLEADSLEELQKQAQEVVRQRRAEEYWSVVDSKGPHPLDSHEVE